MSGYLEIKDLYVKVGGKEVLSGLSLNINKGERHVLMGANASGKTTLAMAIMGFPQYGIARGEIRFDGRCLNGLTIDERAGLGMALTFQSPPAVDVNFGDFIDEIRAKFSSRSQPAGDSRLTDEFNRETEHFRHRNLNDGLSGGEKKRSELIQILAMRPELIILDEIDSGVDIDSLGLIGRILDKRDESMLIVTHYHHILDYIKADRVHLLALGRIAVSGAPKVVLDGIGRYGYREYLKKMGVCRECPFKECIVIE